MKHHWNNQGLFLWCTFVKRRCECVIRISKARHTQSAFLFSCVFRHITAGLAFLVSLRFFIFFKRKWFTLWAIVIRSSSSFPRSLSASSFHSLFYTIYRSYFSHPCTFHPLPSYFLGSVYNASEW